MEYGRKCICLSKTFNVLYLHWHKPLENTVNYFHLNKQEEKGLTCSKKCICVFVRHKMHFIPYSATQT